MDDPLCIENYVGCELTLFLNFASFLRRRYQILQSNCQIQISITTNQKYLSFYKVTDLFLFKQVPERWLGGGGGGLAGGE